MITLLSPSDNANVPIQGIVNANPDFNVILAGLPAPYSGLGVTMKARLVQWAYLLNLRGFPIVRGLQRTIDDNGALFEAMFN